MRKRVIGGITAAAMVFVVAAGGSASALNLFGHNISTSPQSATTTASQTSDLAQPCLRFQNHEYEVCTAYVANASLAVLLPYYEYAKSPNSTLARYVTYRLGSRYTGGAYQKIVNRVATWPIGNHDVAIPSIAIMSVASNLQTNTATLVTRESWKVTTESGQVIYQEVNKQHSIIMQRVPSYLLHKWVVTSID
jgi:hypothetical protein